MKFSEIVKQAVTLLQESQRITYRALKREFSLDEEALEDLRSELIDAQRVATDEDGKVLVWRGEGINGEKEKGSNSNPEGDKGKGGNGETAIVSSPLSMPSPRYTTPGTQSLAAERRQLTVEFIDLVGSTTLSQQLDPEDYHARVVAYQTACHHVIARYEGHIAQYLGDGVLVYFGYPGAHEDDAVRAVRSGLEIVAGVSQLQFTPPLQVRIGIHTGPVMIGEIGAGEHTERLALGETPNIAARVQGVAEPDTVVVSVATYRLIEGLFACEERGQPELKGVATPLTLYRVVKEGEAQSRFQVVARRGLTPLVGREHEYGLLRERWERVKDGAGQIVLLSGEPGIGKSRLVEALKETVEQEGALCLELRCSPYAQNSALQPVIEHLQRLLQFRPDDSPEGKLDKLRQTLSRAHFPQAETLPLVTALLSLPHPLEVPPLTLSPQKQKEKTYEALVAWLCEDATQQAVVYVWEDLHWADPSTLELLTLLLAQVPMTRLLAVLTFRPEFTPPWGSHSYLGQVTLSRLGPPQVEVMVEKVTGSKPLPREVVKQIASKTDGVPLFVEELTKMVVESGLVKEVDGHYELSGPLPPLAIPSTLQDSLMARLDRLATVRELAQLGATIGREFSYELLHAVSPLNEERLQQGLKQLVETELVYQHGLSPQARYLFKHALIQDAAYQSLLKSRRQQYHQQIAHVLEEQFPETAATRPELLAHHYTEAGLITQALPYWQQAGQRAVERSAYVEAISHLTRGLEVLKAFPDTPERVQQELTLHLALGAPLVALKGWGAPEVEQAYTRARELCQQVGQTPQLFPVLAGLWAFYLVRAELQVTRELTEQLLSMAQRSHDSAHLLRSHEALGSALLWLGEVLPGHAQLEQGIALSHPQQYRSLATLYGEDPGVFCRANAAWALWLLGSPDQAWQRSEEALTLAQELSHPFSLAYALTIAAMLSQCRLEGQVAQELTKAVMALATEQGFPFFSSIGTILQGWTLTEQAHLSGRQGQEEESRVQMRRGLTAYRSTGAGVWQPYFLALLAEAHGERGQVDEGLRALAEALALIDKTDERWWEAELYRLKGELTLKQSIVQGLESRVQKEAEECFHRAIKVARRQQAKSLDLRAVMSLSRLWQKQGKKDEAHQMLLEIYGWFTEGFDTKDLQEAKALLEQLAEGQ